ncbi:hypothetical protein N0V90_000026 [Kalmusia sp. IMI 367209]|nr:hypothetical protein N0V90_000026 [Kalmusia sp. IMI 367209]
MPRHLLDLPLEIFQQIVHQLVTDFGVVEAWKLREVCPIFATEIHYDIFTHRPTEVLQPVRDRKLVKRNMGIFLYNRLNAPLDARPSIIARLKELLEFLICELNIDGHDQRQKCARKLCEGLASNHNLQFFLWNDQSFSERALTGPLTVDQKIAAAIAVGAHEIVGPLLRSEDSTLSGVFGNNLHIAIHRGDECIINALMAFYPQGLMRLIVAGKIAIEAYKPDVLELLLERIQQHPEFHLEFRQRLLIHAASIGNIPAIDVILKAKANGQKPLVRREVHIICQHGTVNVVAHYLKTGRIDAKTTYHNTSVLIAATKSKDVSKVRAVLDAGADINKMTTDKRSALFVASKAQDRAMVQYLLSCGADTDTTEWPGHEVARSYLESELAEAKAAESQAAQNK